MKQEDIFASTQIITFHPVLDESMEMRIQYFLYLKQLIRLVRWNQRKYTKAQIDFYRYKLCCGEKLPKVKNEQPFDTRYCYLLPFDLAIISGFRPMEAKSEKTRLLADRIAEDFFLPSEHADFLLKEFDAALDGGSVWKEVHDHPCTCSFREYLNIVQKNISFIKAKPYHVLITATMSAGKSTLINALVGQNISLMQNVACTSKIHTVISKPIEDGVTSEDDHVLSMDASQEDLLRDNMDNNTAKITVSTYFHSALAGERIILFDTPGVNSSENIKHTEISQKMIKSRKYQLMLYVMNSTQLATNDEERHLEIVREHLGRTKVIFIMNKADQLISEDDNFMAVIENQRQFLISKGFKNPVICPVSSRAAYLTKKSRHTELVVFERREMEAYMDKFEQISLSDYYEQHLNCTPIAAEGEEDELFVRCGFAYLEKIIADLCHGG